MAHENRVASARFDLDAKWVVTASDDGTVRLWDGRTGRPYSEPLRLPVRPGDARFTSDGRHVEVAFEDYSIRMFKIARPLVRVAPDDGFAVPEPKNELTVISGNTVELRTGSGGKTIQLAHESTVNWATLSPDRRRVGTSTANRRARVWDASTGQPLTDWLDASESVARVRFSADGLWLLSDFDAWELYTTDGPAPDWLAELAEAIAGENTGTRRVSGPVSANKLMRVRQALAPLSPTNQLTAWAKEFVSDEAAIPQQ
jgi:WD40 repeat protein